MKLPFQVSGAVKEVSYTLIVSQVLLAVGYGRGYVAFLFHQLDLPGSQIILDDEQKSRIAGSIGILSPFGCILSGTLMDIFGRKLYFFVTFIPQIISWVTIALANSYDMLLYGMIIQGISLGMGFSTSTYISEIGSATYRGALFGGLAVFYSSGAMLCNILMYFIAWNLVAWIYVGLSVFGMFSTLLLLESPIWLYNKGRKEDAIRALCSLRATNIDGVKNEIGDMEKNNVGKPKASFVGTMKNVLKAWKPFLMAISLQLLMQLTGYTALFGYPILIFDRLRLPLNSSRFTLMYAIAGGIGAVCAPFLMLKLNRRTHLSSSAAVMAVCTIAVGVYEEIFYQSDDKPLSFIVPVAFYIFSFSCNGGVLLIAYTVGTELYPSEVKGVINGIFGAVYYITWSVILKVYPALLNAVHIKIIIWCYTGCCLAIILFSTFILPETKGKTLNEVQEQYFQKKKKKCGDKMHAVME
ncbi:facilitated trehalose transporter Tret1-like isoform X2 [Planococcus citri]|uniref:facilitated trehalose transporter Tret1-like isoform X2 n=1 Tax=Planococcus citri TaxID=170843 RepID=UPI0031F84C4F